MPRTPVWSYLCPGLCALLFLTFSPLPAAFAPEILHAPGHVIVRLKPDKARPLTRGRTVPQALQNLSTRLGLPAGSRLEETVFARWKRGRDRARANQADELDAGYFLYLHLPAGRNPEAFVQQLKNHPLVDHAELDGVGHGGTIIPNDPDFTSQWHHRNQGNPGADIQTPGAWALTTGNSDTIVAVLDTGLNLALNEFSGRLVAGYDFANDDGDPTDDQGHGTAVTGALAATGNNSALVAGVDWQCRIMPVKVLDENNSGLYSWWAQGIDYAVANGAKVINLSAGGFSSSSSLTAAIDNAIAEGVIFVTITHNDDTGTIRFPGRLTQAITVGATDQEDVRAVTSSWGSNWGPEIDLVAPGLDIRTVDRFGNAASWSGTSFAAPLVAGVCSLMIGQNPTLTQSDVESILIQTAVDQVGDDSFDVAGFDPYYGHGRLNALDAVRQSDLHAADLVLTQIQRPTSVSAGCPFTLSWEIGNAGPAVATNVTFTQVFPASATFVEASISHGSFILQSPRVVFALDALSPGETISIAVQFQATSAGPLLFGASMASAQVDPVPSQTQFFFGITSVMDTEPPQVLSATALPDNQTIAVSFSESVTAGSALNLAHYRLEDYSAAPLPLSAAQEASEPSSIHLTVAQSLTNALVPLRLHVRGLEDCAGLAMATPAAVTVLLSNSVSYPPVFLRHPDSQTVVEGDTVHLKVRVAGARPMHLSWLQDGNAVIPSHLGTERLSLTNVQLVHAGLYSVLATNAAHPGPGIPSEAGALVVLADRDGDLMPDAWEDLHDLNADEPADALEDSDLDGVTNRDEFVAGTHPNDAASFLRVELVDLTFDRVRLSFEAVSNKTYSVQYRPGSGETPWQTLADVGSASTNRQVVVEDPDSTAPLRIYRLATPHQP